MIRSTRYRKLVAVAGVAAAIALNGLSGGSASAGSAPGTQSGCVTKSAAEGQGASTTDQSASTTPGTATTDTAPTFDETTPGTCAIAVGGSSEQTISVQVCISNSNPVIVQRLPTTELAPGEAGVATTERGTADAPSSDVTPGTVAGESGGESAAGSAGTVQGDGTINVTQGGVAGAISEPESTCISIAITNGQPSIGFGEAPAMTVVPDGIPAPPSGTQDSTESTPAQPGTQTSPDLDPNVTPSAPSQ